MTNYVVILVKLKQRKKQMTNMTDGMQNNDNVNNLTDKVTRATFITLGAYIALLTPLFMLNGVLAVTSINEVYLTEILADCFKIFFFFNNAINPVIYFYTLNDFREGYQRLLRCKGGSEHRTGIVQVHICHRDKLKTFRVGETSSADFSCDARSKICLFQ